MSKFKLTQTATEVQDILNNSLQKPTGLTKTKLVGVGANGQENIEIGDNLTLANGKLAAAAGGGSARHGYSIIVNGTFHYEVYTTKDYNLEIRQKTTIQKFFVNNDYAELHQSGLYPAAGYYCKSFDGSDILVNLFEINNGSYYIAGYNMTKSKYESINITPGYSSADVIQLF